MTEDKLEIGGDFDWPGILAGPYLSWPSKAIWYARGRDAVAAVFLERKKELGDAARLLLPDYFCPEVAGFWRRLGIPVAYYRDDPTLAHPVWSSIDEHGAGFLLAVNFFGVRDMGAWRDRYGSRAEYVLIEDQTHDPFCPGAEDGVADFAFASVRKVFPASDGAVLWSPSGVSLPSVNLETNWIGSAAKLGAMVMKSSYLGQCPRDASLKERFRRLQIEGEEELQSYLGVLSISPWSQAVLEHGYPEAWRQRRQENVSLIFDALGKAGGARPLFRDWPPGQCPFNAVVLFPSQTDRNATRQRLIAAGIYAPVHWEIPATLSDEAYRVSRRILTIPVDHRYGEKDVNRILDLMR